MRLGLNHYTFDGFALIKITSPEETYFKVFGARSGGYLDGDSWRMNSGVASVEKDNHYYYFRGNSGSCYKVPKNGGHISAYCSAVLQQGLESYLEMEVVSVDDIESVLVAHGIEVVKLTDVKE